MGKAIEQLSRNLASGMSRRKALWRFAAGIGALGFFGGRKALAIEEEENCAEVALVVYECCLTEGGSERECITAADEAYVECSNGVVVSGCLVG